ncbi:MAG: MoaD/ThiS family protein [Candidatus Longimicrobiales bacterium M2_2A_002]
MPSAPGAPGGPGVVVRVPGPLRALTDGAGEVKVGGTTVAEVLERLVVQYPGLRRHLLTDTGGIRDYVNVFVDADDIRALDGVSTAVGPEDAITIVPSIAGG